MKKLIRTAAIAIAFLTASSLIAAEAATTVTDGNLVYNRRINRSIGITPAGNAVGYNFSIVDAEGQTVFTGRISNRNTFYLPTGRMKKGEYHFVISGYVAQSFIIK